MDSYSGDVSWPSKGRRLSLERFWSTRFLMAIVAQRDTVTLSTPSSPIRSPRVKRYVTPLSRPSLLPIGSTLAGSIAVPSFKTPSSALYCRTASFGHCTHSLLPGTYTSSHVPRRYPRLGFTPIRSVSEIFSGVAAIVSRATVSSPVSQKSTFNCFAPRPRN